MEAMPNCAWNARTTETSTVVGQKLVRKRYPCFDIKIVDSTAARVER